MLMGLDVNLPQGFSNLRMDLQQTYPSFMNMVVGFRDNKFFCEGMTKKKKLIRKLNAKNIKSLNTNKSKRNTPLGPSS